MISKFIVKTEGESEITALCRMCRRTLFQLPCLFLFSNEVEENEETAGNLALTGDSEPCGTVV